MTEDGFGRLAVTVHAILTCMHAEKANFRSNLSLFLIVFLPVVLLVAVLGTWYVHEKKNFVLERYQVEARHHVEGQVNRVQRFYRQGVAVLLALSHDKAIHPALAGKVNARKEIAGSFNDIMGISEIYDQIRLLDSAGQEVVRVDRTGDRLRVVPFSQLQNKRARYYMRQALALPAGAVYVSPFDLNMEHGKVQRPFKSVIRFATSVVDGNGVKRGVLIINMLGISIMQRELSETVLEGEHLLINAGSTYWFDRHMDKLHMLKDKAAIVHVHDLHGLLEGIPNKGRGQIRATEGQLTFESIEPISLDKMTQPLILTQWKIVSFVPVAALAAASGRYIPQILAICVVVILLLGLVIGLWSQRYALKRMAMQVLRHSEARLKLAERDMDMGYWDWDMLSDTVTWSDGFTRIFGFSGTHVTPSFDTVASCTHPDDRESLNTAIVEAIHSDARQETEFRITRDGKERYIHVGGQVIFTDGTKPARMFGTVQDITKLKQAEQQHETLLKTNHLLAQGLIKARENERSMLARALHDDIGQRLTAVQMHVSVVTDQCASRDYDAAKNGLRIIGDLAGGLIESVRNQLKLLRPPQLDELGLKAALGFLCKRWKESSRVDCRLYVSDAVDALGDDVRLNLYRIVQETLTNIARHAGASEAHVDLRVKEDGIHLTIRDDGCGFDPDAQADGIGLAGMRERMDLLGGSMRIESAPGKGTRLFFRAPQAPTVTNKKKTDR